MSNVELKLIYEDSSGDVVYNVYVDNVYAGGLEANYDPRINSFYIENIKKSDSYKAGHLLEDVVNYLYNEKGYDLGCLPLEKYRGYYEELGFTPFIHNGDDIFYHKIHGRNAMKSDEFLTGLKNIINEDLKKVNETYLDFGEILEKANTADIKIKLNADYYVGSVDEWQDMVDYEKEGDFSYETGSVEGFECTYNDLLKSGALYKKGNDLYLKTGTQILLTSNYDKNDIRFKYSLPGNSFSFGQVVAFILAGNKKLQWPTMDLWLEGIDAEIFRIMQRKINMKTDEFLDEVKKILNEDDIFSLVKPILINQEENQGPSKIQQIEKELKSALSQKGYTFLDERNYFSVFKDEELVGGFFIDDDERWCFGEGYNESSQKNEALGSSEWSYALEEMLKQTKEILHDIDGALNYSTDEDLEEVGLSEEELSYEYYTCFSRLQKYFKKLETVLEKMKEIDIDKKDWGGWVKSVCQFTQDNRLWESSQKNEASMPLSDYKELYRMLGIFQKDIEEEYPGSASDMMDYWNNIGELRELIKQMWDGEEF